MGSSLCSGLFLYIRVSFYKKTADSAHCDVIYKAQKIKSISHHSVIYEIVTIKNEVIKITEIEIPDMVQYFIKVPKEVILAKDIPEHRLSAYLYFHFNRTKDDLVHYCPIYMIKWCKYKPNWHRGTNENIYTKFRDSMQWFFENGYLIDFEKEKYIQTTFQSSLLNIDKLNPGRDYGSLYDFEIRAINDYHSSYKPLNKSILFLLLSYIRAFTWYRTNELTGHSEKSKKDKPEIFYSQFTTIAAFIGINRKMVSKATEVLEQLGLIKTHRMPRYKDSSDNWHTDDIIYISPYKYKSYCGQICKCSKEEYDYEDELKYGILYLREKKYVSKKFYQD